MKKLNKMAHGCLGLALMMSLLLVVQVTAEGKAVGKAHAAGTPESVIYKHADGKALTLQIFKPADWSASDKRPAILFFHGGSWTSGRPSQLAGQSSYLAARGMVCVSAQYRLLDPNGEAPPKICIQDAKSAMRWVRSHAAVLGIDPNRIAGAGASAGGHLAAFLAFGHGFDDPSDDLEIPVKPSALILFNPILESASGEFGYERVGKDWKVYSPAQNVARGAPPTIIMVGSRDKILPIMERFGDAMKAVGSRCDMHIYEGQGHSFFNQKKGGNPYYDQTLQAVDEFLVSLKWCPPAIATHG